jgi:hypothetical protein
MFKPTLLAALVASALPMPALAVSDADVAALRAEFDQKLKDLQAAYEARLKDMQSQLAQTQAGVAAAKTSADSAQASAEDAKTSAQATADQAAHPPAGANAFNPEISLILQGGYNQRKAGERRPTGYLQDAAIGAPARGFSLNDTELVMAANIDPYFRGSTNIVLADGQADIEEAWFQTLSLDHGLTLKGGRFISGIGYQNAQHPHAWDFADNNLMYQTLFGEHLVQDGLQMKWLAPIDQYLELGAELGNGAAFPGSPSDRNGAGDWAVYGHLGGDVGDSSSWRAGLSYLAARPSDRHSTLVDSAGAAMDTAFSGASKTWIADFVWKWAPGGNPHDQNFKFQSELFQRDENGDLVYDPGGVNSVGGYHGKQTGGYAQAIYQFMPNWRVGLRYDRLSHGSVDYGANSAPLATSGYSPNKWSLMTDYAPSEFSQFRLQLARDHSMLGNPDDSEISLQYIYSLGPHGAHTF